jgi:hypothetical protein
LGWGFGARNLNQFYSLSMLTGFEELLKGEGRFSSCFRSEYAV